MTLAGDASARAPPLKPREGSDRTTVNRLDPDHTLTTGPEVADTGRTPETENKRPMGGKGEGDRKEGL